MSRSLWEKVNDENYPEKNLKEDFLAVLKEIFVNGSGITEILGITKSYTRGCIIRYAVYGQTDVILLPIKALASPNVAQASRRFYKGSKYVNLKVEESTTKVNLEKVKKELKKLREKEKALTAKLEAVNKDLEEYEHG